MERRTFLVSALGLVPAAIAGCGTRADTPPEVADLRSASFEVTKTDAEWRSLLTPAQFRVLRNRDTERAGSSPLDREHRSGTFHCAGCDLPLYASSTKFDSGTGWPSFYASLEGAIGTSMDYTIFGPQTEVHCRRCGGHLGHVFDDGPRPTGKRHCINGVALIFKPA